VCLPFFVFLSFKSTPAPTLSLSGRNFTFDDVHVEGAGLIAKVSASVGVPRLVHVSHLNASPTSTSQFYRSKAAGEAVVREAFPSATIVRPGPMFGYEDKFLNNISCKPSASALGLSLSSDSTISVANMVEPQSRSDQDSPGTCARLILIDSLCSTSAHLFPRR
jgi:hypothetical protein